MKKYLILFIVLSLVIILPVAYPRWSRARREKRIAEVITKARQVQGTALSDILAHGNPAGESRITILYTGNTQSHLEPYGYYRGRSGGVARRAAVVERLKGAGFSPLVLDAGEIFSGETPLDQKKSEVYLKAMELVGYDAVCISAAEFRFGTKHLREQMEQNRFPFLSANLLYRENEEAFAEPYVIKDVGKLKVAVTGISNIISGEQASNAGIMGQEPLAALKGYTKKLGREADVIILLSNLTIPQTRRIADEMESVDVIISSKDGETEVHKNPIICYSDAYGKTMGMISLSLDTEGNITSNTVQRITMEEEICDKPEVRELVSSFYRQTANTPELWDTETRLFASEALEQDPDNGYIGASSCTTCHPEEHQQWTTTPHASAFSSLVRMQQDSYPGCVVCHVTGFGYEAGYEIDQPNEELKSVSCETCHGPGEEHSFAPTKENIRSKVPVEICTQCHTEEYSPGFVEVARLIVPKVDHSQKSVSVKEMLEDRISSLLKPTMDLFVMSYCPFGVTAEEKLIPILKEFEDRVDFNLYFIAQESEDEEATGSVASRFKSLHGQTEVIEDIRQVVIEKYYKDKLLDYILERNKDLKKNWVDCARKLEIDPKRVQEIMESEEGATLFKDNIKRSQELDIRGSPTIMIDSIRLSSKILHAIGAKGSLCK